MIFRSRAAPLALYRSGKLDEALELSQAVQAHDPFAAEAALSTLLIALRKGDEAALVDAMRKCLVTRSAEWVVDRMRADFVRAGTPPIKRDLAFRLGGLLRNGLKALGPVLPPAQRRAAHEYVNVVGTSYVRSFGGSDAFFPLFIGMGPTMLLLTEDLAAITQRKFAANIARIDPRRHTMLVLGGDPYYHATNLKKTRTSDSPTATDDDYAMMQVAADRHRPILAGARKAINGRLLFLGATPSHSVLMDQLSLRLNEYLKPICAEYDVELLDWWSALADPVTQHLRADYGANAYPGDVHFSLATTKLFMTLLQQNGVLSSEEPPRADFEWTHVFECEVDSAERTRIWSEPSVTPNNAMKSHKIASSHLGARVADLLSTLTALRAEQTICMVNVRDGHAAVTLPSALHSGCVAITDTEPNFRLAQVVLDFYGRSDVDLRRFTPDLIGQLRGVSFDIVVLAIHPDTAADDERRCNEVMAAVASCETVIIMTPLAKQLDRLELGQRTVTSDISISNKHVPESWHDYRVFIAR